MALVRPRDWALVAVLTGVACGAGQKAPSAMVGPRAVLSVWDASTPATWTFDGASWTPLVGAVPGGQPHDSEWPMATLGNQVVLFGGSTGNETWSFDGASWTELQVMNPPPPCSFGGCIVATLGTRVVLLTNGQTYAFDGAGWTHVVATPPTQGVFAAAGLGDRVVIFDGANTWTFDGASWTQVMTPGPQPVRTNFSMATLGRSVVLFGGVTCGMACPPFNDTWNFDGAGWTQVMTPTAPPGRGGFGLTALGDQLVLFGGSDGYFTGFTTDYNDTWAFDGVDWRPIVTENAPPKAGGTSVVIATLP